MSFSDKINEAIRHASSTVAGAEPKYRKVLDDLAEGLSREGVIAHIVQSAAPRTLWLTVAPPFRPGQRSPMLRFELNGERITIGDVPPREFTSVEALEEELLAFVTLPAFLETLEILRRRGTEPVDARLHWQTNLPSTARDVMVEVSSADQRQLYEAKVGARVAVTGKPLNYPGNGKYVAGDVYDYLESAGVFVEVEGVEESGGALKIKGVRRDRFPFVGQ